MSINFGWLAMKEDIVLFGERWNVRVDVTLASRSTLIALLPALAISKTMLPQSLGQMDEPTDF